MEICEQCGLAYTSKRPDAFGTHNICPHCNFVQCGKDIKQDNVYIEVKLQSGESRVHLKVPLEYSQNDQLQRVIATAEKSLSNLITGKIHFPLLIYKKDKE